MLGSADHSSTVRKNLCWTFYPNVLCIVTCILYVCMYIYVYICMCNYIIRVTIYNIHVCALHIYIHTYTLWNIQKYRFVFTIISNRLWSTLLCFSISLLVLWFPSMIHFQSSMKFFSASSQELNIYQLHRKSQKNPNLVV